MVKLQINSQLFVATERGVDARANLGVTDHELAGTDPSSGNGLHEVGEDQRTGGQLLFIELRHIEDGFVGPAGSRVEVFSGNVQAIASRRKRDGFLVERRAIAGDYIFKCLGNAT